MIIECAEDLKKNHSYYQGNDQLFKVDKDSPKLPPEDVELLHRNAARQLYPSKREKPDIKSVCCIPMHTNKIANRTKLQRAWKSY